MRYLYEGHGKRPDDENRVEFPPALHSLSIGQSQEVGPESGQDWRGQRLPWVCALLTFSAHYN